MSSSGLPYDSYRVSPNVRRQFSPSRFPRRMRMQYHRIVSPRRYLANHQRAYSRNLIRGDLVAHRRMFGVSHKSVQSGTFTGDQG